LIPQTFEGLFFEEGRIMSENNGINIIETTISREKLLQQNFKPDKSQSLNLITLKNNEEKTFYRPAVELLYNIYLDLEN